jgi:acetyltransferase-like isoleucine patch superfamily enzyme
MIKTKGRHTYSVGDVDIFAFNEGYNVNIGNFCSIARGLLIFTGGYHRTDRITSYPFGHVSRDVFTSFDGSGHPCGKGDVNIQNDVWIGHSVTIMSGVTVGNGSVIAAKSHVVKDVEPYSIVGGNPARHIKYRFSEEQRKALSEIQWWNWEDSKINDNLHLLCSDNIDEFISKHVVN